ncbi:MAG: hypothetical protein ACD_42C00408G0006 [uncultured bacterium]|nr:MAG: hypothetical protein ACD_42C00408G0006 [uncultured bacterium]OGT32872.1 MAG: hypothetical protein A3C44_04870 [Gammaproteobacteria bacterium RIFCSPHIGHO2_02_FULL_39_13]OGT50530.1 MAG: hypothetical protein A3E53_03310 [Gammaproteobacteria bacterium RIFCSPHIGHO2_12_FULL_39_24]
MKKIFLLCVFIVTLFGFTASAEASLFPVATSNLAACPSVPSYKDSNFCTEFETTVICSCDAHFSNKREWPVFCKSVTEVYTQMMALYHSIKNACTQNQPQEDLTECRNQWHCAMFGKSFSGVSCSGNPVSTQPCPNIN